MSKQEITVKKGFIALLVVLAVVVLVSPGLIGRVAEKSVDENLNWAAAESGEIVVTSTGFDRGWFSSEGQHRVQVKDGQLHALLSKPGDGELPVLIIDTRLDHGLVPFSSMSREKGSLTPGLGSAISTLSVELPDGESVELPGKIFSKVALGGELQSNFVLEAGSHEQGGTSASWGDSNIDVTTNPSTGDVEFAGDVGTLKIESGDDIVSVGSMSFSGAQAPTEFGFAIGDVKLELNSVSMQTVAGAAGGLSGLSIDATSSIDGSDVNAHTVLNLDSQTVPQFGEFSIAADVSLEGADAAALGELQKALDAQGRTGDPNQMLASVEGELKALLANGLELRFDRLDVTLPMGTVITKLDVKVAEEDPDTFDWSSLLLGTEASASLTVPEALVDMAVQMNPQAGAVVGMGFLKKNGDVYEMEAEYKKGLLTINGAPMPIPLGSM